MYLLQPKLPEGANVAVEWSSDKPERRIVRYRSRVYEISGRQNGNGACFDFSPPILTNAPEPGKEVPRSLWNDRAARLLTDYWYLPALLAGILVWWKATGRRPDPPDQDPG